MTTLKSLVDETTNIKDEIVDCHSNLSNILTSKNVEVSEEDKISDLIRKIEETIESGKKWASGDVSLGKISIGTTETSQKIAYSLDFVPSIVFVKFKNLSWFSDVNNFFVESDDGNLKTLMIDYYGNTNYYIFFSVCDITKNSFTIKYKASNSGASFQLLKWYAIE